MLKNSGYSVNFRREILSSGINGYNKILEADRNKIKPLYRPKGWNRSARRLESRNKSQNWLGPKYKSCIFVPPTPGSELKQLLQQKEVEMRPGGREDWPIKIIETSGKSLERCIVKTDPFNGNQCLDKTCLPAQNKNNKISCRMNNIGYRIPCKICIKEGKNGIYIGETGENMHVRMKSHLTKFNSKKPHIRDSSAFFKHLQNTHGGLKEGQGFADCFFVEIVKAYKKPMTRQTEEGTFMINTDGELLNSKTEWHQPKIVRTTIYTGGAELAGGRVLSCPQAGSQRPQGNGVPIQPGPVAGGQDSTSSEPVQQALRRSSRRRNA